MMLGMSAVLLTAALSAGVGGEDVCNTYGPGMGQTQEDLTGGSVPEQRDAVTGVAEEPVTRACATCHINGPLNVCASPMAQSFLDHTEWLWCTKVDDRQTLSHEGLKMQIPERAWSYVEGDTGNLPWSQALAVNLVAAATRREDISPPFYAHSAPDHYEAFGAFPIAGSSVLIAGSISPWLEAIVATFGATKITTSEHLPHDVSDYRLSEMVTVQSLEHVTERFDAIVSFSSIEHDGLGAYGDPINANGDLCAMQEFHQWLRPGGLLFLGIPVGRGSAESYTVLRGNLHRIYGSQRLERAFRGFELLSTITTHRGRKPLPLVNQTTEYGVVANQPVFVLRRSG